MNYNGKITRRWNKWIREHFVAQRLRRRLVNKDITILANNCNAGFIYHDLGLQFKSPTINLFFFKDHFLLSLNILMSISQKKLESVLLHIINLKFHIQFAI